MTAWCKPGAAALFSAVLLMSGHGMAAGNPAAKPRPAANPAGKPVGPRVEALLKQMTLDEKVGQMVQAVKDVSPDDVKNFCLGSVLSGGGGSIGNNPAEWADSYDRFQKAAMSTRLKIPIIYGLDAVHGHNNVSGAVMFPHNIGLGATRDPDLMKRIGQVVAEEVLTTGPTWTFAPCLTVPRNERWGRTYEGFSEDPKLVGLLGAKYVEGFQGPAFNGRHLVACIKHWAADGGTQDGKNMGDSVLSEKDLLDIHVAPYIPSIKAGAWTVMVSYNSINGTPCHINKHLTTDILKKQLGFKGFVISDWLGIGGRYVDAINSGIDMGMEPTTWRDFINAVKDGVVTKKITQERIDDAVRRILTVKFVSGLMDNPYADRELLAKNTFGSKEHRAVAREAVRKSLVLLKNDGILPLAKKGKIFVSGRSANNIGMQCGGWTISWLGGAGNITPGTTILEGLKQVAPDAKIDFDENGNGAAGHDVALVIIGEPPYAEGYGDRGDLHLEVCDQAVLNNVLQSGVPTLVVLVSGRPMLITDEIKKCKGFVAAWLPGTEGAGIADVLFGDFDFTGKLPHTWPTGMDQIPINTGDPNYKPLFPYGFGLSCRQKAAPRK